MVLDHQLGKIAVAQLRAVTPMTGIARLLPGIARLGGWGSSKDTGQAQHEQTLLLHRSS
jgi:hypothetical protein